MYICLLTCIVAATSEAKPIVIGASCAIKHLPVLFTD